MSALEDFSRLPTAPVVRPVLSEKAGYVKRLDARGVGNVSMHLGGGRAAKEDDVDRRVGVVLTRKTGEAVSAGECLCEIHAASEKDAAEAAAQLLACYEISPDPVMKPPLVRQIFRA